MSRYGQRSRLTGSTGANTVNYWFGGGFSSLVFVDYLVVAGGGGSGAGNVTWSPGGLSLIHI